MGKTEKGKEKIKAKKAKAKRKIARKCKEAVAALALCFLCGCATSDSAQPAKSQTQNNEIRDCTIIIAAKVRMPLAGTNQVIEADGGDLPTVELLTQTQSLESSGTETYSPTATQTPTTDVKPDIDVKYNDAIAGASAASRGVLETLMGASANKVLDMMANKTTGTVEVTKTDGTTATVQCADGQCSICTDGNCTTKTE